MKYGLIVFAVLMAVGIAGLHLQPSSVSQTTYTTQTSDGVTIFYNLYQPQSAEPVPVVVIGHGVMVNKEMMTLFAVELAARGYIVATIDWRGHGRSTGVLTRDGLNQDLEAVLVDIPSRVPADMDQLALLGYSMGAAPTYQYAAAQKKVKAWVGVGAVADGEVSTVTTPHNVLMTIARHDEAFSPESAKVPMARLTGRQVSDIEFETVYGSIEEGTARKIHVVPGADHLTTPWNSDFVLSAALWISQTFEGSKLQKTSVITFYPRVLFLCVGIVGLIGFLGIVSRNLADMLGMKENQDTGEEHQSIEPDEPLYAFVAKYYTITLVSVPGILLFVPLFLTPLPFTALLTALTGGLGIGMVVYCWRLIKSRGDSFIGNVKKNLECTKEIWIFSLAVTSLFVVGYYLLVGKHFLGMIPSITKLPYLVLYVPILWGVFFVYSLFIQKYSICYLEKKLPHTRSAFLLSGLITFLLIYSWFALVVLVPCFIMDNYFFAMILILMIPIFSFLTFFSAYMEKITGSVIPNAVLQSVWLGLVITTLSPYTSGLLFG